MKDQNAKSKMTNQKSKSGGGGERRFDPELLKKGLRCDSGQYKMLLCCSEEKDITEWNKWRTGNPDTKVTLQGALLNKSNLRKADLRSADLFGASLVGALISFANLENAILLKADLRGATLFAANLKKAELGKDSAFAEITLSLLPGHPLFAGNVKGLELAANLREAILVHARLQGCDLSGADIRGADFRRATVDSATIMQNCKLDPRTDFRGVALGNCLIQPGQRQLLEYNIRRKNWEDWYKEHWLLKWPVRWFWCLSDYGLSTWRVIIWFFGLALGFATIYANCACWWPPGIVSNLAVEPHLPLWHYFLLVLLRPVYFSVVTMTTLGFGDMYASATSIWGHILLTFQVILGYVLLGALVTRFAVLFTAGGPAGRFADEKKGKTRRTKSE